MTKSFSHPLTKEEAENIMEFLSLPLSIQGKLLALFTPRSQFIIDIIDCLRDGPHTYHELAETLNLHPKTIRHYCGQIFRGQHLPIKKKSVFDRTRYPDPKPGHWCYQIYLDGPITKTNATYQGGLKCASGKDLT